MLPSPTMEWRVSGRNLGVRAINEFNEDNVAGTYSRRIKKHAADAIAKNQNIDLNNDTVSNLGKPV